MGSDGATASFLPEPVAMASDGDTSSVFPRQSGMAPQVCSSRRILAHQRRWTHSEFISIPRRFFATRGGILGDCSRPRDAGLAMARPLRIEFPGALYHGERLGSGVSMMRWKWLDIRTYAATDHPNRRIDVAARFLPRRLLARREWDGVLSSRGAHGTPHADRRLTAAD